MKTHATFMFLVLIKVNAHYTGVTKQTRKTTEVNKN